MMNPLPKEFDREGFHFKQLIREGNVAIYEQSKGGVPICHEVVLITCQKEQDFISKEKKVLFHMEAKEIYPGNEAIGRGKGLSFGAPHKPEMKKKIESYFNELVAKDKAKQLESSPDDLEINDKSIESSNNIVKEGLFAIKDYMAENKLEYPKAYLSIKELLAAGKIKLAEQRKSNSGRGKKTNYYIKV